MFALRGLDLIRAAQQHQLADATMRELYRYLCAQLLEQRRRAQCCFQIRYRVFGSFRSGALREEAQAPRQQCCIEAHFGARVATGENPGDFREKRRLSERVRKRVRKLAAIRVTGAAGDFRLAIDHGNVIAAFRQVVGRCYSDDACANHGNVHFNSLILLRLGAPILGLYNG